MRHKAGEKWNSLTLVSDLLGGEEFRVCNKSVFLCDCGCTHFATLNNVKCGVVKHCSACSAKKKSERKKKHGNSYSYKDRDPLGYVTYSRWQSMKRRCYDEKERRYHDYGGRGIKVCDRWLESYENFLADMGVIPTKEHQIDRKDNDGNYEPENCHWVSRKENSRNKRNNRLITAFGKTAALCEWAEQTGIKRMTISRRLERGYTPEDALNPKLRKPGITRKVRCPLGEFDTITDMAKAAGMSVSGTFSRIKSENYPDWCYV